MTGGAQEEGVKEEAEERGTINREVVAGFRGLGGIDTPLPLSCGGGNGRVWPLLSQGHLSSGKLNSRGWLVMFDAIWSHA